jgi:hypothetical protein
LYWHVANCACGSVVGVVFLPLGFGFSVLLLLPVVVKFPLLLVCRVNQCMGPGPEFGDSSIPAGSCVPVSFDGHIR